MADVRLEWAERACARFEEWNLLEVAEETIQQRPDVPAGWSLSGFALQNIEGLYIQYCFQRWSEDHEGVALYTKEECHPDEHSDALQLAGILYVRKVPACRVLNCQLSINETSRSFRARFSTLGAEPVLMVEDMLDPILLMEHLCHFVVETVESTRVLLSINQDFRIMLNNSAVQLPENAVLWFQAAPIGWLQQ